MITCSQVPLSEIELGRMDAEYYRPDLIKLSRSISKQSNISIRRAGATIDCSAFYPSIVSDYSFYQKGIPFLRVNEIQNGLLSIDEKTAFLPKRILDLNRSTIATCEPGDLIIAKGGNSLGKVALLTNLYPKYSVCRDVLIIRTQNLSKINRFFLWIYLHSAPGQSLLIRTASQTGQPHLTIESIAKLKIPLIPDIEQDKLESSYHAAEAAMEVSRSAYTQAQHLLESELGLDKLKFKKPVDYTARFSDTLTNGRFDADYYRPQFAAIHQTVKNYSNGYEPLINIAAALKPNIDPAKTPNQLYNYIELSNINPTLGTVDGFGSMLGKDLPSRARRQVINGDVIASAVVGSVDKAAVIDTAQSGFIASTGFFHFRPIGVSSEYLLILVKSKCVRMQFQQQATGGILSAVPDSRLKNIIVPKLQDKLKQKISDLVFQSHRAKKKSQELLDQAKARVEQLIEEAAMEGGRMKAEG